MKIKLNDSTLMVLCLFLFGVFQNPLNAEDITQVDLKSGQTMVLKVTGLTDVSITDDKVVDVVALSKTEILINAKAKGISDVTIRDELGLSIYRCIILNNYDSVIKTLKGLIENDQVQIEIIDKLQEAKPVILLRGVVNDNQERSKIIKVCETVGNVQDMLRMATASGGPGRTPGIKIIEPYVEQELTEYFRKTFQIDNLVIKSLESKFAKILYELSDSGQLKTLARATENLNYSSQNLNRAQRKEAGVDKSVSEADDENLAIIIEGVVDSEALKNRVGTTAQLYARYVINNLEIDRIAEFRRNSQVRKKIITLLDEQIKGYNKNLTDSLAKLINLPTVEASVKVTLLAEDLLNSSLDKSSEEKTNKNDPSASSFDYTKLNIYGVLSQSNRTVILDGTVPDQNVFADVLRTTRAFLKESKAKAGGAGGGGGGNALEQATAKAQGNGGSEGENDGIINKLSIADPFQVLFNTYILEITKNFSKDLGIDWGSVATKAGSGGVSPYDFSTFSQGILRLGEDLSTSLHGDVPVIGAPLNKYINPFQANNVNRIDPIAGLLKMDQSRDNIRVLANPKVVVYTEPNSSLNPLDAGFFKSYAKEDDADNGASAKIQVGGTSFLQLTGANGVPSTQEVQFGTSLRIHRPSYFNGQYNFRLYVESSQPVSGGGDLFQNRTRNTYSVVNMKDGETLVLGGLIDEDESKGLKQIPNLHRIPILGKLFESERFVKRKTELMVFITPTLNKAITIGGLTGNRQTPTPVQPPKVVESEKPQPKTETRIINIPQKSDRLEKLHRIFSQIKNGY